VRPGAYPRVEHLKGLKGLAGTNALAYYEKAELTVVKSFITLATGPKSSYDVVKFDSYD
jgi:hypothetical protein